VTRYAKTIVALLGALATWGITAAEDDVYSQVELWGALLAVVTAAGVYAAPYRASGGEPSDRGATDVVTLLVIVLIVVVILAVVGVL
jgi:4-amino-4-deoxy-L-arabinose transferase-like glycosyltransferase